MDFDTQAKALFLKQLEEEAAAKKEARRLQEEALRAQLEAASPMSDMQLAPLAGAIDSAFGTRVAPGIQAAEAKREPSTKKADEILDLLMASPKGGVTPSSLMKTAADEDKQAGIWGRKASDQEFTATNKLADKVDAENKKLETASQDLGLIESAIVSRDPGAVMNAMIKVNKGIWGDVGAMSDQAEARAFFKDFSGKLDIFLNKIRAEGLSEDTLKSLKMQLDMAKRLTAQTFKGKAAKYGTEIDHPAFKAAASNVKPQLEIMSQRAEMLDTGGSPQKPPSHGVDPEIQALIDGLSKKKGK